MQIPIFLTILAAVGTAPTSKPARPARDIVGVSHVAGRYHFTDKDYLNEGADALLAMHCRVIKVWMVNVKKSYPFNSDWPPAKSLVELAKTRYFRDLFDKPFTTFILETYAADRSDHYYLDGMSVDQIARERQDLDDFTAYLLETYRDTGKTFILQNWEGDWSLRGGAPGDDPSPTNVKGMIDWFNARQDGVEAARERVNVRGVYVYHAAEVNHVARAMKHEGITVTNDILPNTRCDLYSYSAYDVPTHDPMQFRAALEYLKAKSPDSAAFGAENVYVGEYGAPENVVGGGDEQLRRIRSATETALDFGARYVVYWELYCNEPTRETTRPTNADLRGFWLIRPDGSKPPVTAYFEALWKP